MDNESPGIGSLDMVSVPMFKVSRDRTSVSLTSTIAGGSANCAESLSCPETKPEESANNTHK
jgi:hypothetical protein